jgi:oligogalacturonide lyase
MKPHLSLLSLILALVLTGSGAHGQPVPSDWIDPVTGHRVIRLSGDAGGSSLYFHQNAYTPSGDKLVFNTKAGITAIDLTRLGNEPVMAEVVVPGERAIATAWRTPDVYYAKSGAVRHEP